jgi:hypothetical protein
LQPKKVGNHCIKHYSSRKIFDQFSSSNGICFIFKIDFWSQSHQTLNSSFLQFSLLSLAILKYKKNIFFCYKHSSLTAKKRIFFSFTKKKLGRIDFRFSFFEKTRLSHLHYGESRFMLSLVNVISHLM